MTNTVEELLLRANPVLDPEELRLSPEEVSARCSSILEGTVAMQTQTPIEAPGQESVPRRWSRPRFAFAIGLLVILVTAGVVALLITGDDKDVTETPTVTTTPTTIASATVPTTVPPPSEPQNPVPDMFTFAEDDLCEWMSADKLTALLRDVHALAGVAWRGTAVEAAAEGSAWDLPGSDYCRWEPTGGGYVIARGLTLAQFGDPFPFVIEYSGTTHADGIGVDAVHGHPDLPEGVIAAHAAFGRYGFWLEGSDEVLGLELLLGDEASDIDWAQQERMLFNLANAFLLDMKWVPTTVAGDIPWDWLYEAHSLAVSGVGPVFVSSSVHVASFDEEEGWALVDLSGLPEGAGLEDGWPGRMVTTIATGPRGELWVAGHAYSPIEDAEFVGSVNEWTNSRVFTWLARRDCEGEGCTWRTFGPDQIPALNTGADIGALAVAADGTFYGSMGENQLLVVSGTEGKSHTVPNLSGVFPWARTFALGSNGLLWAGTNHGRGLVTFDGTTFARVTTDEGLPSNKTSRVAAATDGTIWVAIDGSISRTTEFASFDGSEWTSHGTSASPDSLFLGPRAAVDGDGILWTVTSDGLTSFDGDSREFHPSPFHSGWG